MKALALIACAFVASCADDLKYSAEFERQPGWSMDAQETLFRYCMEGSPEVPIPQSYVGYCQCVLNAATRAYEEEEFWKAVDGNELDRMLTEPPQRIEQTCKKGD